MCWSLGDRIQKLLLYSSMGNDHIIDDTYAPLSPNSWTRVTSPVTKQDDGYAGSYLPKPNADVFARKSAVSQSSSALSTILSSPEWLALQGHTLDNHHHRSSSHPDQQQQQQHTTTAQSRSTKPSSPKKSTSSNSSVTSSNKTPPTPSPPESSPSSASFSKNSTHDSSGPSILSYAPLCPTDTTHH